MKKSRLATDYSYNFTLLGIASTLKEYKMAFKINQVLQVNLIKQNDIVIDFVTKSQLVISNYLHLTETLSLRLLRNKSYSETDETVSLYLVPELKNIDYLIQVSDESMTLSVHDLVQKISEIEDVSFVTLIDSDKLKSKENLIFE